MLIRSDCLKHTYALLLLHIQQRPFKQYNSNSAHHFVKDIRRRLNNFAIINIQNFLQMHSDFVLDLTEMS